MARQKKVEPKPDIKQLEKQFTQAFHENIDKLNVARINSFEASKGNYKVNFRSQYEVAHILPPVVEETEDGFRVYHSLYLTKPLYRKIELLAQLKDTSFTSCLIDLAEDQIDAVLDNSQELAEICKKRISEEVYGLGTMSPSLREEKLEQELEGEKLP